MEALDKKTWARKEIYAFFEPLSDPFYVTSFPVDVTKLYAYKKARGVSFYYALCWLSAKAMNSIENFRYTMRNGELFLHDERIPSFTDIRPGSDLFYYVTPPFSDDLDTYCRKAKETSEAQTVFVDLSLETDALIYVSCLPELAMTGQSFIHNFSDPGEVENNIPRISWGKYEERDGKLWLTVNLEVNHRFVDGVHVSRFAKDLQARIDGLSI